MNLFGFLLPSWVKWAGMAAFVLLLVGAGWKINGWKHRAAEADAAENALVSFRETVSRRDAGHVKDMAAEQRRAEDLAKALTAVADLYARAQGAIPNLPLVTHHEAPPNPAGRCDVPVRSPVFRMCHNAAWTGDPAGLAACTAYAGDGTAGSVVPATGLVRPREP